MAASLPRLELMVRQEPMGNKCVSIREAYRVTPRRRADLKYCIGKCYLYEGKEGTLIGEVGEPAHAVRLPLP
jgi:hypothetical protein